jgi:hypothetical protein
MFHMQPGNSFPQICVVSVSILLKTIKCHKITDT